ncbi:MAG: oxidoreductase, partial [Methanolinea sp.]|nr:oxidoreductase [Methanolinea sp.]
MPECINPLWPCALTGAAACLAGFRDIGVIIHGSSGCYFYPATVLHAPLHCTGLNEEDIIFGTEKALLRTVDALEGEYECLAVLCTCVPSITGEDLGKVLDGRDILVMESPGFMGEYEAGYLAAAKLLHLKEDSSSGIVNVDGLSLMDPFYRGD